MSTGLALSPSDPSLPSTSLPSCVVRCTAVSLLLLYVSVSVSHRGARPSVGYYISLTVWQALNTRIDIVPFIALQCCRLLSHSGVPPSE